MREGQTGNRYIAALSLQDDFPKASHSALEALARCISFWFVLKWKGISSVCYSAGLYSATLDYSEPLCHKLFNLPAGSTMPHTFVANCLVRINGVPTLIEDFLHINRKAVNSYVVDHGYDLKQSTLLNEWCVRMRDQEVILARVDCYKNGFDVEMGSWGPYQDFKGFNKLVKPAVPGHGSSLEVSP
jgi:hypothetical protein